MVMIGERIGDWEIDAALGSDARGQSYRAHAVDVPTNQATVRVLTGQLSAEFLDLFRGRLLVLRKLTHPNIVAYLGGGIVDGNPYYVTEHVLGADYQALLREGKRPNWPDVLSIALQAISALRHAHRRGVLHGDLKPGNLIQAPDGKIKLAEAGIARLYEGVVAPPGDNPLASSAFISPEQAAGKPATKRSDFYSLGCLLYALLTGKPPFTATNPVEMIHKHCFVMPERPAHFLPELPDELDAFVMKLLAKDPQVRPGSGTLLLAEAERVWASLEARGKLGKRPALPADEPLPPAAAEEKIVAAIKKVIKIEKPPRPVMSRPIVVIPLFLLCVLAIILGFRLTRTDPDDLFARAQPLMRSEDPADWEKAWTDYLEPLSRDHPDRYTEEIRAFRSRTLPLAELRKAQAIGKSTKYSSEAERFYNEGVRLCQAGDFASARRTWERVVAAFAGIDADVVWVELARQAAARVAPQEGTLHRPGASVALRDALARAKTLKAADNLREANAIWDALDSLYRDDPDAAEIHDMIQKERGS
jgi:eukaryotic-like serine/threonine-protein kinase